ncbi:MAG: transposase, partial [Kofleriaceae bacterium]
MFKSVALRAGERDTFRVVHVSIQSNHLHLLIEAEDAEAIARGMQRFQSMAARALNKVLGRKGKVFAYRYHRVDITTPRQMRCALAYVLNNWR